MLLKRTIQEILRDAAISIAQNSKVTNFFPGSIARSITEAIAPEIGTGGTDPDRVSLYDFAQAVLDQGYISKATGSELELIGGLFSYNRRTEEIRTEDGSLVEEPISDDLYRYEISQIVPSAATANYAALRLALLTINGVQDIIPKEYSHGTGSFSFILIAMYGFDEQSLITQAQDAVNNIKAFGIKPNIMVPVSVPIDLTVQLMYHEGTSDAEKTNIQFDTKNKITSFIGSFELGASFIYNELVQQIMNASDQIIDFEILKFYLNNEPVLLTNQGILDDERLVPQNIEVS